MIKSSKGRVIDRTSRGKKKNRVKGNRFSFGNTTLELGWDFCTPIVSGEIIRALGVCRFLSYKNKKK